MVPVPAQAEGFNNRDFLALPEARQKSFLDGVIDTVGHVAALKDKKIGQCIYDWYFGEKMAERNWLILASIKKYPEHTPSAVIIALTERECGKYT